MSVQAIAWALEVRTGGPGPKALLLALANYADQAGECYPGLELLAFQTEMSESTVKRTMNKLVDAKLVNRTARGDGAGGRTSNLYRLAVPGVRAQNDPEGLEVKNGGVRGQTEGGYSSTVTSYPLDPLEPKENAQNEGQEDLLGNVEPTNEDLSRARSDAFFAEFWTAYPKRVSKLAARRRWDQLLRRGTDPLEIISGAKLYARACKDTHKRFIKNPDGWLNAGKWEDEIATDEPDVDAAPKRVGYTDAPPPKLEDLPAW